jgi:hypothetical protein
MDIISARNFDFYGFIRLNAQICTTNTKSFMTTLRLMWTVLLRWYGKALKSESERKRIPQHCTSTSFQPQVSYIQRPLAQTSRAYIPSSEKANCQTETSQFHEDPTNGIMVFLCSCVVGAISGRCGVIGRHCRIFEQTLCCETGRG